MIYPEGYDVSRIQSQKLYIGSNPFTPVEFQGSYRVEVKSSETGRMLGKLEVRLWLHDEYLGLRKPKLADLLFEQSKAEANNDAVNTGADIALPLSITENIITVDHELYNIFRCKSVYEIAVENGYEGPEDLYNEQLGSFQALYDGAVAAKETAETAAGTATSKAQEASGHASDSAAAKDLSVAAKDLSVAAAGTATSKAQEASGHANDSAAAKDLSVAAKDLSVAARDKSQKWAEEAENVEVETGKYSAKHHALKAEVLKIAAEQAEANAEAARLLS